MVDRIAQTRKLFLGMVLLSLSLTLAVVACTPDPTPIVISGDSQGSGAGAEVATETPVPSANERYKISGSITQDQDSDLIEFVLIVEDSQFLPVADVEISGSITDPNGNNSGFTVLTGSDGTVIAHQDNEQEGEWFLEVDALQGKAAGESMTFFVEVGEQPGIEHRVRVTDITWEIFSSSGPWNIYIEVKDEDSEPVRSASVVAILRFPDWTEEEIEATTDSSGVAGFPQRSPVVGSYQIRVIDVTGQGLEFERASTAPEAIDFAPERVVVADAPVWNTGNVWEYSYLLRKAQGNETRRVMQLVLDADPGGSSGDEVLMALVDSDSNGFAADAAVARMPLPGAGQGFGLNALGPRWAFPMAVGDRWLWADASDAVAEVIAL